MIKNIGKIILSRILRQTSKFDAKDPLSGDRYSLYFINQVGTLRKFHLYKNDAWIGIVRFDGREFTIHSFNTEPTFAEQLNSCAICSTAALTFKEHESKTRRSN